MCAISAAIQLFSGSACPFRTPYFGNNALTNHPRG
jgi:hypothetical protein